MANTGKRKRPASVPISLRIPESIINFLPQASLTGERSAWVLEALLQRLMREGNAKAKAAAHECWEERVEKANAS